MFTVFSLHLNMSSLGVCSVSGWCLYLSIYGKFVVSVRLIQNSLTSGPRLVFAPFYEICYSCWLLVLNKIVAIKSVFSGINNSTSSWINLSKLCYLCLWYSMSDNIEAASRHESNSILVDVCWQSVWLEIYTGLFWFFDCLYCLSTCCS